MLFVALASPLPPGRLAADVQQESLSSQLSGGRPGLGQVSQAGGSCHYDVPEGWGITEESKGIQPQGAGELRTASHALTSFTRSLATFAPVLSSVPLWTHSPQFHGPGPTCKALWLSGADHLNQPPREGLVHSEAQTAPCPAPFS